MDIKAGSLDLDQLLLFASDFMEGSGAAPSAGGTAAPAAGASTADLTVTLAADRATMAGVSLDAAQLVPVQTLERSVAIPYAVESTTSAPRAAVRSRLGRGASDGMTITAGMSGASVLQ